MTECHFEVGDEVVVARTLGSLKGMKNGVYYHGGDVNMIPLGSFAEVKAINRTYDAPYCNLFFPKLNVSWAVYVEELELADEIKSLDLRIPGFKEIGKHPLFELFGDSKIFLLDKKVYSVDEFGSGAELAENYFEDAEKKPRKSVINLGDLSFFEELMEGRYSREISKAKENYVQKISDEWHLNEIFDMEMSIPQLIFKKVFPYLRAKKYDDKIKKTIGIEEGEYKNKGSEQELEEIKSWHKQKLESIVNGVMKKIEEHTNKIQMEKLRGCGGDLREKYIEALLAENVGPAQKYSEKLLEDRNIAVIGGNVYDLISNADLANPFALVNIEGKAYSLKKASLSLDDLERSCRFNLGKQIRVNALKEQLTKDHLTELLTDADELKWFALTDSLKEQNAYSEEDFGFIKRNNQYYVYLDVPAFAVKSFFDKKYYFFDKTEIAVRVEKNQGALHPSGLFITKNNNNPILHRNAQDFMSFCLGFNRIPYEGKDSGEIIAKQLRKGKDILLYGYLNPRLECDELREKCTGCGQNHFGRNIRPLDELQKMGVQILQGGSGKNYC